MRFFNVFGDVILATGLLVVLVLILRPTTAQSRNALQSRQAAMTVKVICSARRLCSRDREVEMNLDSLLPDRGMKRQTDGSWRSSDEHRYFAMLEPDSGRWGCVAVPDAPGPVWAITQAGHLHRCDTTLSATSSATLFQQVWPQGLALNKTWAKTWQVVQ